MDTTEDRYQYAGHPGTKIPTTGASNYTQEITCNSLTSYC